MVKLAVKFDRLSNEGAARDVEFEFARQFDDCFGVMAVLEQRIFDGLRAIDEQAAIEAMLLLGDPVAAAVSADEDDGGSGTARWRFDELHVGIPFDDGWRVFPAPQTWLGLPEYGLIRAANIFPTGYEFEGGRMPIS
jgi:hypothetical protein